MKFNWLKSKKNLFFILLFIIDLSAKFIIDKDNFTFLDFFVKVLNYLILASISPLIVKASKVSLNRDNNIFILMLSLVLSGFSISFIKSSYDVFLLTNKNGNIFLNGYLEFASICVALVLLIFSLILLIRTTKFIFKKS